MYISIRFGLQGRRQAGEGGGRRGRSADPGGRVPVPLLPHRQDQGGGPGRVQKAGQGLCRGGSGLSTLRGECETSSINSCEA